MHSATLVVLRGGRWCQISGKCVTNVYGLTLLALRGDRGCQISGKTVTEVYGSTLLALRGDWGWGQISREKASRNT